jgi:competence protein ComEC
MNRPLLWVAGSYAIGIALAATYPISIAVQAAVGILSLLFCLISFRFRWRRAINLFLILAIFCMGGLHYSVRRAITEEEDALSREIRKRHGQMVTLQGTVLETTLFRPGIRSISFVVEVDAFEDDSGAHPTSGKAHVTWHQPEFDLRIGDRVAFRVKAMQFSGSLNPGATQFYDYLHRRGIHTDLRIPDTGEVAKIGFRRPRLNVRLLETARRKIHETFRATLDEEHADFLSAVWLGERNMFPLDMKKKFIESGTYHFTVVSGIHVFIVYSMVTILLGIPATVRKRRIVAAIMLVVFYAFISGANPPVLRATIMAVTILVSGLLRREPDRLSMLCLACLLMLVWNPLLLFRASFQLSFLAATAIVMLAPMVENFFLQAIARRRQMPIRGTGSSVPGFAATSGLTRLQMYFLRAFSHVLAIVVFMAPVTARYFGILAPVGILANPVVIPLIGPLLSLAALASVSGAFSIPIARLFSATNRLVMDVVFGLVEFFSGIRGGHFTVESPSNWSIAFFYAAMFLVIFHKDIRLRKRVLVGVIAGLFACSIIACVLVITPAELEVVFLDVGQGDCIFVQLPDDGALLIDGGPVGRRSDVGERVIARFLREKRVGQLEAVVVSHPQADHIGGLPYVLENFRVKRLLTNGEQADTQAYARLMNVVRERNIPVETLAEGAVISAGEKVRIRALHPPREPPEREGLSTNGLSLVLQMSHGKIDFLFTGDIGANVERDLCEEYADLESEVLKVPHHGSRRSSSMELLDAVRPQIAVVQVGRNNSFGHPNKETLERYESVKCRLLRTDMDGAITVRSNGKTFRCRTEADYDLNAAREFIEAWEAL